MDFSCKFQSGTQLYISWKDVKGKCSPADILCPTYKKKATVCGCEDHCTSLWHCHDIQHAWTGGRVLTCVSDSPECLTTLATGIWHLIPGSCAATWAKVWTQICSRTSHLIGTLHRWIGNVSWGHGHEVTLQICCRCHPLKFPQRADCSSIVMCALIIIHYGLRLARTVCCAQRDVLFFAHSWLDMWRIWWKTVYLQSPEMTWLFKKCRIMFQASPWRDDILCCDPCWCCLGNAEHGLMNQWVVFHHLNLRKSFSPGELPQPPLGFNK